MTDDKLFNILCREVGTGRWLYVSPRLTANRLVDEAGLFTKAEIEAFIDAQDDSWEFRPAIPPQWRTGGPPAPKVPGKETR